MLLKELDEEEKSNRDALMEIIKITALSNGDLEALIINRSKFPKIPIITVHQSKGLEYDTVFLAGLKENTFLHICQWKQIILMKKKDFLCCYH